MSWNIYILNWLSDQCLKQCQLCVEHVNKIHPCSVKRSDSPASLQVDVATRFHPAQWDVTRREVCNLIVISFPVSCWLECGCDGRSTSIHCGWCSLGSGETEPGPLRTQWNSHASPGLTPVPLPTFRGYFKHFVFESPLIWIFYHW